MSGGINSQSSGDGRRWILTITFVVAIVTYSYFYHTATLSTRQRHHSTHIISESTKKMLQTAAINLNFTHHVGNYEDYAISLLPAIKPHTDTPRKGILCTTFIAWKEQNYVLLQDNIIHTHGFCDWLVIVYNSYENSDEDMNRIFDITLTNRLSSRKHPTPSMEEIRKNVKIISAPMRKQAGSLLNKDCKDFVHKRVDLSVVTEDPCAFITGDNEEINTLIYPKVALFTFILKYLQPYKYIWSLDGDLILEHFQQDDFFAAHQCGLPHPPLVAQPLIHENTKVYKYLGTPYWDGSNVIACRVGFVEIQVPFIDAEFFEWFTLAFVHPMFTTMHILGADWGFDNLFCAAAGYYQKYKETGNKLKIFKGMSRVFDACAVITNSYVDHTNSNEIRDKLGGASSKKAINQFLMDLIKFSFPNFHVGGNTEKLKNPGVMMSRNTVYKLKNKCPLLPKT